MAALIKHGLSKNNEISITLLFRKTLIVSRRCYANKHYKQKLKKVDVPECRKLKSTEDSLSSKGFLRCQRSYNPPSDVSQRLEGIYDEVIGDQSKSERSLDSSLKHSLLNACFIEFKHGVPNSILHTITNYNDLLNFYQTPIDATLPLEKMKNTELPPNLHVQYEPLRFLPEEDTMFGGQTAFPKSNTLVSGLRTRKKYKGHKVIEAWPDV